MVDGRESVFFEIRVSRRSGRRRRREKKKKEKHIETFILPVLNSRETINRGICRIWTKRSRKSREIFEHLRYIIIFSFYAMILLSLYYCSFDTRLNKFMGLSIVYGTILKRSKQSSLFTCFSFLLKKFLPWFTFIYTLFYSFIFLEIFTNSLKIELTRFSIRNILPHF